jgi:hypothetical protein
MRLYVNAETRAQTKDLGGASGDQPGARLGRFFEHQLSQNYAPGAGSDRLWRVLIFDIEHTVRYTELSPTRFKDFWRR